MASSPIPSQTLVDIDLFSEIRRIEDALGRHSCTEALAWCSENKTALRKIKARTESLLNKYQQLIFLQSTLEFDLRMQEYIELCRTGQRMQAIAYSNKYLVPWQETHMAQIQQLSGLLAFPSDTTCGPYRVSQVYPIYIK